MRESVDPEAMPTLARLAVPSPHLPRTAKRCTQLVAASARATLDPFEAVDWNIPIDDTAYHLPPEWLPLFGTAAWNAMTESKRIEYSRHEAAAMYGAGIWFENQLMQIVLRHLVELPVTDPSHRYLLVEVADECRHSTMFGEFIRQAGTPAYTPDVPVIDYSTLPGGRALGYLLILAVEELLDAVNRATMKDARVHPVSRQCAKLHVLEEARHVSFAKTYLSEVWDTIDLDDRSAAIDLAPAAVYLMTQLTIDPNVYATLDIDDGAEQAKRNPHHRARMVDALAKLTEFLRELGVINDANEPEWRGRGLIA